MNGFSFICNNILHSGENDKIQIKVSVSCECSTFNSYPSCRCFIWTFFIRYLNSIIFELGRHMKLDFSGDRWLFKTLPAMCGAENNREWNRTGHLKYLKGTNKCTWIYGCNCTKYDWHVSASNVSIFRVMRAGCIDWKWLNDQKTTNLVQICVLCLSFAWYSQNWNLASMNEGVTEVGLHLRNRREMSQCTYRRIEMNHGKEVKKKVDVCGKQCRFVTDLCK